MRRSGAYCSIADRHRSGVSCYSNFLYVVLLYIISQHAGHSSSVPNEVFPETVLASPIPATSAFSTQSSSTETAAPKLAIQAFSLPQYSRGFKRWSSASPTANAAEPLAAEGHKFTRLSSHFKRHRDFPQVFFNDTVSPSLPATDKQEQHFGNSIGPSLRFFDLVNKTAANWSVDTQYAVTSKHFLPTNFTFLAAHADTCLAKPNDTSAVKGLILMPSGGTNVGKRNRQRKSFPPGSPSLRRFFFVGVPVLNADAQTRCENSLEGCKPDEKLFAQLQAENAEHQDLIISLTIDTYQGITVKWLSILHWAVRYCPQAKVLFKMDDDALPNMPFLVKLIDRFSKEAEAVSSQPPSTTTSLQQAKSTAEAQAGSALPRGKVAAWYPRDGSSAVLGKWMGGILPSRKVFRSSFKNTLTIEEYPNEQYAKYAGGWNAILSMDVVRQILRMVKKVPYLPIDDAYLGIVGHFLGLTVQDYRKIMGVECGPAALLMGAKVPEEQLRKWERCYNTTHLPLPPL